MNRSGTNIRITRSAVIFLLALVPLTRGQHSGHEALSGILSDVAVGNGGHGLAWYRYIVQRNEEGTRIYHWSEYSPRWMMSIYLRQADRIVSFKSEGSGHHAVCSDYGDDIYVTDDGGLIWQPRGFPRDQNRRFTTVEILNWGLPPGRVIFVGCEASASMPTAYYTIDWGMSWHRLGGDGGRDPIYGLTINDIESLASGELIAATEDGIFRHDTDYDSPWEPAAFEQHDVTAIDNIELGIGQQVAAVQGEDGLFRLYCTNDAWKTERKEVEAANGALHGRVWDIAAIYWGQSHMSCYAATDDGAFLFSFEDDDPSRADVIDLGSINGDLNSNRNMTAVDYYVSYADSLTQASVLMAGTSDVYEIREYRQTPGVIDSISIINVSSGLTR
jgi:hypothetical protein